MASGSSPYVELQSYSNFSFLRGASHPEELFATAAKLGYSALALTDRHSLAGIVRAHFAAKEHGIACIVGTHIHFSDASFSLLLYPSSRAAYGRLSSLLTLGKLRAPKGKCFLSIEDLKEYHRGLLAIATINDFSCPNLLNQLSSLRAIFNEDRLSISLSNNYNPENYYNLERNEKISRLTQIPLVVTNNIHYHSSKRRPLQDVLTCVRLGCTLQNAGFSLLQNAERYLKPPQEIARLFKQYPQALRRSHEIAELALQFSLDELRYEYPKEICPKDKEPIQYLKELVQKGMQYHYPSGTPDKVEKQIQHELTLIRELDYAKYFLTVYDIVRFARGKNILCQGRGAAANSAVCYVLGITSVDPDRINLLFERFISKERDEPPDIDIDFEHERREEVIQYIYAKYGRRRAALTAAVVTYRTKSAVRDTAKVFGLSEEVIQRIIKLLTRTKSDKLTKDDLIARNLDPNDKSILRTIILARRLRGFPRHLSQHTGGFIISEEDLSEIVPIENASMAERTIIEWDKDDIDRMGMLKIDILALGMLTMIRKAFSLINENLSGSEKLSPDLLMLHKIPAEDPKVYDMICRADTIGVFQIESRAQMSMLPRLRPRCFYDLVIEVAIVRPGPIQGNMVHPYLRRRNGNEKISYPNKQVEKILSPTLGVPIFQEQVMELAVVAAGFTLGEADQLRRAMASWKKSSNLLESFGNKLMLGMKKNGYSRSFANRLFQQIKGFGEYGFPQSHAASFAFLVYVSSWIKKHHPAVFAAALLNSQPMGFYRPAQIVEDAKKHGVTILPVDILHSGWDCSIEYVDQIPSLRLGMRLVKGLSKANAEKIIDVASKGKFQNSLLSLWKKSEVGVSQFRKLARADAFSSLHLTRQKALWELKRCRDEALPLFESIRIEQDSVELPTVSPLSQVTRDYAHTGLSLKAHPVSFLREALSKQSVNTNYDFKYGTLDNGDRTAISGMVLVRQRPQTASGVIFMTVEDETEMANIIIKPKVTEEFRDIIYDSTFIIAIGKLQRESEVIHLIAEELVDITPLFEQMESMSRDFR